jgi:hypothetical protein
MTIGILQPEKTIGIRVHLDTAGNKMDIALDNIQDIADDTNLSTGQMMANLSEAQLRFSATQIPINLMNAFGSALKRQGSS